MLNKVILMGRLTRDPELRHTQNNTAVASFSLAVNRDRKVQGQPDADFLDIVAFGKQAEFVSQWFTKGLLVAVTGRLQRRDWEDKNGNKRVAYEIITEEVHFAESKKSHDHNGNYPQDRQNEVTPEPGSSYDLPEGASDFAELSDDDGKVPF